MMTKANARLLVRGGYLAALALIAIQGIVAAQRPVAPATLAKEELTRRIAEAVQRTLEEQDRAVEAPFVGITTDGTAIRGLFPLRSSGVSTAAVRAAVRALLHSLTAEQRRSISFPLQDDGWRKWVNTGLLVPDGIALSAMTAEQRRQAIDLLRASLSERGLTEAMNIMKLNQSLVELTRDTIPNHLRPVPFGQWSYWLAIFGNPDAKEPWGWQIEGHHLIINYVVVGDQVVMTPTFMGAEPAHAASGEFAGTEALQAEQNKGWALFESLSATQRTQATIRSTKGREEGVAGAYRDNLVLDYAGIRANALSEPQRALLLDVMSEYVGRMRDGHARVTMAQVREHLDATYFAFIGAGDPGGVFYYRVQSPVILIEFDHNPMRDGTISRNHIHTVVRTPNGNDYGKDLLRQHYLQYPHTH